MGDVGTDDARQLNAAEDDGEHQREEGCKVVARSHLEHHRGEHLERAPQLEHAEEERQGYHERHKPYVQADGAEGGHPQGAGEQYLAGGEAELQTEEQREGHGDTYHTGKATHEDVLGEEREVAADLCGEAHEDGVAHLKHDGVYQDEPETPPLGHEVAKHGEGKASLLVGHSVGGYF